MQFRGPNNHRRGKALALCAGIVVAACSPAGPQARTAIPEGQPAPEPETAAVAPPSTPRQARRPGDSGATTGPADPAVQRMADLVNTHRRSIGCDTLRWSGDLAVVAQAHSRAMRAEGFFEHEDPAGRDAFDRVRGAGITGWRMVAENLALTPRPPEDVLDMWLDSPGHRANLENCDLEQHGIGKAEGFWTHVFTG